MQDNIVDRQTKYLRDEDKLAMVSHRFGEIKGFYVIYRGKTQIVGDIPYLDAEAHLKQL